MKANQRLPRCHRRRLCHRSVRERCAIAAPTLLTVSPSLFTQIGSLGLPQPMRLGHKQGPVAPSSPAHYHLISSPTQALSSSQSGSDHSRVFSMPGPHEQRCHASPPRLSLSVAINRATSARRSDLPRVATIGSRPELFNFSPHRSRPLRRHPTFFPSPSTTLSGSGISFSS